MKTRILLISLSLLYFTNIRGQKAKDVLEDAIGMNNSQSIIFTKADVKNTMDNAIEYRILETKRIGVLKDSIIFLVKGELVKTYMTPLNPLNYSTESKNELLPDKIDTDAADAIKNIVTYVKVKSEKDNSETNCNPSFSTIKESLEQIKETLLNNDRKKEITASFIILKNLDFKTKIKTKDGMDTVKRKLDEYQQHFNTIDKNIKNLKEEVQKYECGEANTVFLIKNTFNQNIKDLISVKKEQFKRVENLKLALSSVENMYNNAISNEKCEWCVEVETNVTLEKGKIASYTLTLKKSGYRLATEEDKNSTENEIIAEESKNITQKMFYFRKFKRFVPEVSSGIAYTNLDFPKYGAVTDTETGELKVAKIGNDNIKRINITAMINYNYYIDSSDIHPFVQLGAGINTDFPTLFLGTGLRFNAFNGGRFAVSVGFAGSWIKSLDSLKTGDVIQDDSDVEKDIIYEFAKPKLYYGIQFNF